MPVQKTPLGAEILTPAPGAPVATIELKYGSTMEIARDRLPQLATGILVRTQVTLKVGDRVDVVLDVRPESIVVRARGEVQWVTPLATSSLVGLALQGATPEDQERLDHVLGAPAGLVTSFTPALTPAIPFAPAPALSVAMLEPNPVLRQILGSALGKVAGKLGERWSLKLEANATPEPFLASLAGRRRQLAVIDCDAVPGPIEPLIEAVRAIEGCARLPILLIAGNRPARLEDRFAVTMQKPLTVKAFVHTTELLLSA